MKPAGHEFSADLFNAQMRREPSHTPNRKSEINATESKLKLRHFAAVAVTFFPILFYSFLPFSLSVLFSSSQYFRLSASTLQETRQYNTNALVCISTQFQTACFLFNLLISILALNIILC
jgi:hypothetical protein